MTLAPTTPASDRYPAGVGPLLALLHDTGVEFVVVGPIAAYGRGAVAAATHQRDGRIAIDITPAPAPDNLDSLSTALTRAGSPRLRVDGSAREPTLTVAADLFSYLPVLPLTTDIADVTIVLHPVGGPPDYQSLLDDASTIDLDGVSVLAPSLHALVCGLAGGWQQPNPTVIEELQRIQRAAALREVAQPDTTWPSADPSHDEQLHRVVLDIVEKHEHPVSVRELVFAASSWRAVTYRQVKAAAETLTAHGQLLRIKAGTAHRYRRNADPEDRAAHEVAALLMSSQDPEAITGRALKLLRERPR